MRRSASTAGFALGAVLTLSALVAVVPAAADPLLPVKPNVSQSSIGNSRSAEVERARDAYRAHLESDLKQKQAMQVVQQKMLSAQESKLGELRKQLIVMTQSPDAEGSSGGGGDDAADPLAKEVPPVVQASRAYGIETYRANVLREALLTTNRDIAELTEIIKRVD